jgi:hypothetical protein
LHATVKKSCHVFIMVAAGGFNLIVVAISRMSEQ